MSRLKDHEGFPICVVFELPKSNRMLIIKTHDSELRGQEKIGCI